jgi:hypothetical protein
MDKKIFMKQVLMRGKLKGWKFELTKELPNWVADNDIEFI